MEGQHRTRTFQKQCREFLRKDGIDYDERYVGIEATRFQCCLYGSIALARCPERCSKLK
jgi:hypothetical protein